MEEQQQGISGEVTLNQWRKKFIAATNSISSDVTYEQSAAYLRSLVKSKLLRLTDMKENPARFFEAHRLLLAPSTRGPGFGIRFTVQFNLFAGSVLGLGSPEQVKLLDKFEDEGRLGCFCLTEKMAGVNSGLIVGTTCTWVPERQKFLLHCPDEGSEKNWISQGLTASKAVVIADLVVEGKHYGPHGFLIDLRESESGKPLPGISMQDMGKKTTGNDLDNARINFDHVWLEKSCLLNRFADVVNDEYVQTTKERMRLEIIGQRLLTGRLAISQAALMFAFKLFEDTRSFALKRKVWSPPGAPDTFLYNLPQLSSLFVEADQKMNRLMSYTKVIEKDLSEILKKSLIPSPELVEKIAAAKISCVETSIELCFKLKQEVGSYGLMDKTGFEHVDFLQCCKFAEGDSRILGQKIARDTMKAFQAKELKADGSTLSDEKVMKACTALAKKLGSQENKNRAKPIVWNENWRLVYAITNAVIEKHVNDAVGPEPLSKL